MKGIEATKDETLAEAEKDTDTEATVKIKINIRADEVRAGRESNIEFFKNTISFVYCDNNVILFFFFFFKGKNRD